jgi:hypothetical protein
MRIKAEDSSETSVNNFIYICLLQGIERLKYSEFETICKEAAVATASVV